MSVSHSEQRRTWTRLTKSSKIDEEQFAGVYYRCLREKDEVYGRFEVTDELADAYEDLIEGEISFEEYEDIYNSELERGEKREYSIVEVDGVNYAIIDKVIDKSAYKNIKPHEIIETYIFDQIDKFYPILSDGEVVYIGEDLPNEYTHSKYTQNLNERDKKTLKVKNRFITNFGEIINVSKYVRKEQAIHTENKDAKYGVYKYKTNIGLPKYDIEKNVVNIVPYTAELVIIHSSDHKKYLYDITKIKEKKSTDLALKLLSKFRMGNKNNNENVPEQTDASNNIILPVGKNVKRDFSVSDVGGRGEVSASELLNDLVANENERKIELATLPSTAATKFLY